METDLGTSNHRIQRSTCFTVCSAIRTMRAAAATAAFASVAEIGSGSYSARFFSGRSRRS